MNVSSSKAKTHQLYLDDVRHADARHYAQGKRFDQLSRVGIQRGREARKARTVGTAVVTSVIYRLQYLET